MQLQISQSAYKQGKKYNKSLLYTLLLGSLLLLALALCLGAITSLFSTADHLMRLEAEPFNYVAAHLMPAHDEIQFKSNNSELQLSAWFFKSRSNLARGNVIFVHHNRSNRMQFGLDSSDLFKFLRENDFNVLALDLRHAGKSEGEISTYGFKEADDVIAAMQKMYALTASKEFILMGIGTGATASLLAWDKLAEQAATPPDTDTITRQDVKALIFDTPVASAYDYIRADLKADSWLKQNYYKRFIPSAVRIACGGGSKINLIPLASQIQAPMLILRNLPDSRLSDLAIDSLINERLRLNPETTMLAETKLAGHLSSFKQAKENYLAKLEQFLNRWFE